MTPPPDAMATDLANDSRDPASARPCSSVTAGSSVHPRPVFLNLMRIQMLVGALTAIGHRISGIVLAASVPWAVYLLKLSLRDTRA